MNPMRELARETGADLAKLVMILSNQRPAQSKHEDNFVKGFIGTLPGIEVDDYGNYILTLGDKPNVMWSCHTDTVCTKGGHQNVKWDGNILKLNEGKPGQCLGADDGAGMWLLLEMIRAGKPGLYIFHREEEIGGLGSKFIARNTPELVDGIDMAIAFDRRNTKSIITKQGVGRTCSDTFADAFSKLLDMGHYKDTGGTFTDTANYIDLIGECTNVSVGYMHEHGPRETLDVEYLLKLRKQLLDVDVSTLPISRKPGDCEPKYSYSYTPAATQSMGGYYTKTGQIVSVIQKNIWDLAQMYSDRGISAEDLQAIIDDHADDVLTLQDLADDADLAMEEGDTIFCWDCRDWVDLSYYENMPFGDVCPQCGGLNVEVDNNGQVGSTACA